MGGAVATFLSLHINTWAAEQLSIGGNGDPTTGARAAIYIAPFVEEATKATVLFWIAMLVRYQLVTKLNGVTLAGLAAVGFAFTENIIYYARAIMYTSSQIDTGDAEAAVLNWSGCAGSGRPSGIRCHHDDRPRADGGPANAQQGGAGAGAADRLPVGGAAAHDVQLPGHLRPGPDAHVIYFAVALPLVASAVIYVVRQLFRRAGRSAPG